MQAIKRRPSVRRGGVIYLSVEDIDPSPVQPRKTFDDGDLNELSQSIAEYGILNPLTVRLRDNATSSLPASADCVPQSLRGSLRCRAFCSMSGSRTQA